MKSCPPAHTQSRRWLTILAPAILLTGCVSTSQVPVSEPPPSNGPHRAPVEPAVSQPDEPAPAVRPAPKPPVAIRPGSANSDRTARAVAGLLSDGRDLYQQGRYEASISVAERAMRIDRYDPRVYLLLAQNYLARFQLGMAEQLARQGLSVSSDTPSARQALRQVLDQIEEQKR